MNLVTSKFVSKLFSTSQILSSRRIKGNDVDQMMNWENLIQIWPKNDKLVDQVGKFRNNNSQLQDQNKLMKKIAKLSTKSHKLEDIQNKMKKLEGREIKDKAELQKIFKYTEYLNETIEHGYDTPKQKLKKFEDLPDDDDIII